MYLSHRNKILSLILITVTLTSHLFSTNNITAYATLDEFTAEAEARKQLPIHKTGIKYFH